VLRSSWDGLPFGHNRYGPKIGKGCAPLAGSWVPSNTMWPGPRPSSIPSGILIHPARLATKQTWAENWGAVPLFGGRELGLHLQNVSWPEAYLRTKWHLDPSSCLATMDMGWKLGAVPLLRGIWVPHVTQCHLGRGLPPHQVASWSIQPFGHNRHADMGRKWGWLCPFGGGRAEFPSNTMWPGPRPTCTPSFILIHQPFGHNTPTSQTGQTFRQTDNSPIA